MKKFVICSMLFAAVIAMAYTGCGATNNPHGVTPDGSVDQDSGTPDGNVIQDGGKAKIGSPCEEDENCETIKWQDNEGNAYQGICLNFTYCSLTICDDPTTQECIEKCDIPGGYCFLLAMWKMSGSCTSGAHWVNATEIDPGMNAALCVKNCVTDAECRTDQKYWCWKDKTGIGACVPDAFHKILPDYDGGV